MSDKPRGSPARLAVVNPNATELITRRIEKRLAEVPPPVPWTCLTNSAAPVSIESAEELRQCEQGLLDLLTRSNYEAAVVAGFVDPAVAVLRQQLAIPIIGMGAAALLTASSYGPFGILGVHHDLEPLVDEFVASAGYTRGYVGIASLNAGVLDASGGDIDTDELEACFGRLCQAGAKAVCLGSGSIAHRVEEWQPLCPVPLIDGITQAAALAATLLKGGKGHRWP